jgi:hypothetical protein
MYLRAVLCTFQISIDFYCVPVGGRGVGRGWGRGGGAWSRRGGGGGVGGGGKVIKMWLV